MATVGNPQQSRLRLADPGMKEEDRNASRYGVEDLWIAVLR